MKSLQEFLNESKTFKKGDKVKIKNVKSYDSMAKSDTGTVIDFMNKDTVMVKVGSGQMNVDLKDLQLDESLTESKLDEAALSGIPLDKDFQNLNKQVTEVREGWRDIRRKVSKIEGVDRRQLSSLDDKIDDATRELASELDKVHSQLKKMVD